MAKETEPLQRIHIRVFERDYEWLKQHIGLEIGHNKAIRYILRQYIKAVTRKAQQSERGVDAEVLVDKAEMQGVGE